MKKSYQSKIIEEFNAKVNGTIRYTKKSYPYVVFATKRGIICSATYDIHRDKWYLAWPFGHSYKHQDVVVLRTQDIIYAYEHRIDSRRKLFSALLSRCYSQQQTERKDEYF